MKDTTKAEDQDECCDGKCDNTCATEYDNDTVARYNPLLDFACDCC